MDWMATTAVSCTRARACRSFSRVAVVPVLIMGAYLVGARRLGAFDAI